MAARRLIKFDDILDMLRCGAPVVAPDGSLVVFTVTKPDIEHNRNQVDLYALGPDGQGLRQLTHRGSSNQDPAFSPDGTHLAFVSNRSGSAQVWVLPLAGGEARQVTDFPFGARQPQWFPDGNRLAAVTKVMEDCRDLEELKKREEEKPKHSGGRLIDSLMFRHWDAWTENQLEHIFSFDLDGGAAVDHTPGNSPCPPRSLSGTPDFALSPDGNELCFVCLRTPDQAVSTNLNLWTVPISGGDPVRISPWEGANTHPVYSPDGRYIAFTGMRRAGYEADLNELLLYNRETEELTELAPGFDRSVQAPVWDADSSTLYFAAQDQGTNRIYRVGLESGSPDAVTSSATDSRPAPAGESLIFARQNLVSPPELFSVPVRGGEPVPLTYFNRDLLAGLDMNDGEDFWYEGADGWKVHGVLVKPPAFDPGKKYPVVFVIHGGPQAMSGRDFHERWNPQLFASPGYVCVMINPRGSTGYGQEFTDGIRGEWGGKCYQDLLRGFDYVLENYAFCDGERTAAAGASFGGFMVNWIAGQTDRFRCLVSHDGIFNTEMMNWLTDELWFTEWEFKGLPWESPEAYREYSPHRFVQNMSTPMFVIQGEQDFRCVTAESLGLFTALQRKGVPSQLLYFPDEGHWVLRPVNRRQWYKEVLSWLGKYLDEPS